MSERAAKVSRKLGADSAGKLPAKAKTGRIKRGKVKGGRTGRTRAAKNEQALEPITPFNRGLSIGVKFAGLTACVVGLFMGLLGSLTYSIAAQNVDEQINEQGITIVDTLEKTVDRALWVGRDDPVDPDALASGQPVRPPKDFDQIQQDLKVEWRRRLGGLVDASDGKIVAISILDKDRTNPNVQSPVVQYPPAELALAQSLLRKVGDVQIFEGLIRGKRIRRFDKPIDLDIARDQQVVRLTDELRITHPEQQAEEYAKLITQLAELTGKTFASSEEADEWRALHPPRFLLESAEGKTPWVSVFVRAERLDAVKSALWQRIAIVTACGAVAGILLTVLISAVLTGPIRELEQDIALVAGGDLGHQSRVKTRDEIGALAHVFNIMTRNLATAQNNAVERQAFERELNIAKEIQEKLLPERIPQIPGFDIHSHYNSAKEVGGDYYDFIVIDQTHLGIIVADVAGKGIPGAMVMTMARSLVRLASVRNVSPGDTFKKVNRILAKDIRRGMFVTAAYMVLNVKTRTLRVASAGHNPVVLYRAKTGENELIKPAGIALGFDKGTIFDNHIKEVEVQLEEGDRIVTYTDGVNEAMNNDSEEFGEERFFELVKGHARKSSKEFVDAIVKALDEHRGAAEQSDDITITTLSVSSGGGAQA